MCLSFSAWFIQIFRGKTAANERRRADGSFPLMYYVTIAFLLLDPLYLSILCGLFGGGDMNGIALLLPEWAARIGFGALLIVNGLVFWKLVLPVYSRSFSTTEAQT